MFEQCLHITHCSPPFSSVAKFTLLKKKIFLWCWGWNPSPHICSESSELHSYCHSFNKSTQIFSCPLTDVKKFNKCAHIYFCIFFVALRVVPVSTNILSPLWGRVSLGKGPSTLSHLEAFHLYVPDVLRLEPERRMFLLFLPPCQMSIQRTVLVLSWT